MLREVPLVPLDPEGTLRAVAATLPDKEYQLWHPVVVDVAHKRVLHEPISLTLPTPARSIRNRELSSLNAQLIGGTVTIEVKLNGDVSPSDPARKKAATQPERSKAKAEGHRHQQACRHTSYGKRHSRRRTTLRTSAPHTIALASAAKHHQ
ncbi:hypothetical protein ADJ70_01785 [Olsenella sp. oral taxon 807]|uniref:hypothetical protein n=1 Tax=Olsenella sp. oral taxon 807 TaxID=712411 RepID=UPI00067A29F9|nr:hypothetical protein [Olsenella sp. oral taxon 807]AKT47990.1 hypothetical protein ADJ70_01785 [Olsenella sp. oral taxon 807]